MANTGYYIQPQKKVVSRDKGVTWEDVVPAETRNNRVLNATLCPMGTITSRYFSLRLLGMGTLIANSNMVVTLWSEAENISYSPSSNFLNQDDKVFLFKVSPQSNLSILIAKFHFDFRATYGYYKPSIVEHIQQNSIYEVQAELNWGNMPTEEPANWDSTLEAQTLKITLDF